MLNFRNELYDGYKANRPKPAEELIPQFDMAQDLSAHLGWMNFGIVFEVKKCIFASTAAVYGNPSILPVTEESKLATLSFYALSKLSAEKYVQLYENLFGLKSCILRFSNVYGPMQASGVVTSILNRLLEG